MAASIPPIPKVTNAATVSIRSIIHPKFMPKRPLRTLNGRSSVAMRVSC